MMRTRMVMPLFLTCCLWLAPHVVQAEAKLQVYPTRITLQDGQSSGSLTVINGGSATGRYRATLQDVHMPEQGALQALPEGQKGPYSAQDYIRISPVSVTVPPGQSQKYRILARVPRDLPDGEYSTHLNVMMSSKDVEAESKSQKGIAMNVSARLRVSVPVVIYKGATSFTASVDEVTVAPATADKSPIASVTFSAQGNRSARGKLKLVFEQGGKQHELYNSDVAVYRGLSRRVHRAGLNVPQGVQLSGGTLHVTYTGDDGKLISEKSLAL